MNKTSLELRKVYLRMKKLNKPVEEIAEVIGVTIRSVKNWSKLTEEEILHEPNKITHTTKLDLIKFKDYIQANPTMFNKEIGEVFGIKKTNVSKWIYKLGFVRKQVRTTYREADPELKKTS